MDKPRDTLKDYYSIGLSSSSATYIVEAWKIYDELKDLLHLLKEELGEEEALIIKYEGKMTEGQVAELPEFDGF